jgi:threonine dehydratase
MPESLAAGTALNLQPDTIADGTTAPVDPGNLALMEELIDRWVVVPEGLLRPKIGELARRGKVVAEGAGVLAYAALEQLEPGPLTVAIVSGGNLAPSLLAESLTA